MMGVLLRMLVVVGLIAASVMAAEGAPVPCVDGKAELISHRHAHLYRTLKWTQDPSLGLTPLDPTAEVSVVQHVMHGATFDTQYLSTSTDLARNLEYCQEHRQDRSQHYGLVVEIDIAQLPATCQALWVSRQSEFMEPWDEARMSEPVPCMAHQGSITFANGEKEVVLAGTTRIRATHKSSASVLLPDALLRADGTPAVVAASASTAPETHWAFNACTVPARAITRVWPECGRDSLRGMSLADGVALAKAAYNKARSSSGSGASASAAAAKPIKTRFRQLKLALQPIASPESKPLWPSAITPPLARSARSRNAKH